MFLIYYVKNGVRGWYLASTKEALQLWAEAELDTTSMSGEDEYEIVDLARSDLQKELDECRKKLNAIRNIIK